MKQTPPILSSLFRLAMLLILVVGMAPVTPQAVRAAPVQAEKEAAPAAPAAPTNTISLRVMSARTEPYWREDPSTPPGDTVGIQKDDPIGEYKYIINVDNTGDPFQERYPDCSPWIDPEHTITNTVYPADCQWPAIRAVPSNAPIVTQGDHTLLNEADTLTLPDGKYMISVISPDFKIDGAWFTLPMEESTPGSGVALVTVAMQPYPLPDATVRIKVFEDNNPTNGGPDVPAEAGLEGFAGHLGDWAGEVTTDIYGNPLCTEYYTATNTLHGFLYDADGAPVPIPGSGGECTSDANGDIVIPHLGPNRFEAWVVPPDGTNWTQTTTLEGDKPWDTWVMEGNTGWDTEFVTGGENFAVTIYGFVQPQNDFTDTGVTGEIKGVIADAEVYIPLAGGLPYQGSVWGGFSGVKINNVIDSPWIALADLQGGDQAVYIGQGNPDGSFSIPHVPDGDYFLTWWDDPNLYILDWMQVTVRNGEVLDLGVLFLTGWWTRVEGYVFIDENENGKMDEGEHGITDYPVISRRRENSEMDRGAILVTTQPGGYYQMENLYPLNQWIILESYTDNYYTTGVTYQVFNQPEPTTVLGSGVDIGIMPVIGQSARVDWGVKPYAPGTNGGIVGTVFYDTTRNELDARYQAAEGWAVGIPNMTVNLWAPVPCGTNSGAPCDSTNHYELASDGSYAKGALLNQTTTESYERPKDCQARDADGNPVDQELLPPSTGGYDCLEPMLMGTQLQNDFATLDGNYGFGEIISPSMTAAITETLPIPPGDYLVEVEVPNDPYTGAPVYQVVREEDINVFGGPTVVPQYLPAACAGPLHTVDVAGIGPDGPDAVDNPSFVGEGGSPYEGQPMPLCTTKLVVLNDGMSTAPGFNFFTPVPIPGRHWGIILDDLNVSVNPMEMTYGEKAGIPNIPIGIYDFTNRLVRTIHSDPNGYFQTLVPGTEWINAAAPSGVSANMFYYVGNDPGQPGAVNPFYNPQYRTIATPFEVFPGVGIVADLAPTTVGVTILSPGSQTAHPAACKLDDTTPQVFAVDKPYIFRTAPNAQREIVITGQGFGATQGLGRVQLGNRALISSPDILSWSERQIRIRVPSNMANGPQSLRVLNNAQKSSVSGVSIHVIVGSYNPTIYEVGPGRTYATIQSALEAATGTARALVVVYPGEPALWNPKGAYYENIVIHSPVHLQGVGAGGIYSDGTYVPGSVINGLSYAGDANVTAENWRTLVDGLTWVGNQQIFEGAVVTVFAQTQTQFTAAYPAMIDGFTIEGGDQQGFPTNINEIGGGPTGLPPNVTTQGGGIYVNGYARYLRITNNLLQNNGGSYGGAIRLGTPNLSPDDPAKDSQNDNIFIGNNMIIANGGTNLAGGIGIFDGAEAYQVAFNDICGNFSAEYGGAVSHYGFSPNGQIYNNRVYFNRSYDEGGGIFIAGELPINPATTLSPGSGPVDVYNNIIQGNLGNDDGGGLRFLMAGLSTFNVYNNIIVNNVSTHEGGGIAINDAPNVRVFNNTIMKNLTTATALTSTGQPAPAGLSTSRNSDLLQALLPPGSLPFSEPVLFNNIFWDNRAGSYSGIGITGLGLDGDPTPVFNWDMGLSDQTYALHPAYSIFQTALGTAAGPGNLVGIDPNVRLTYDTSVIVLPWRTNPRFVGVNLVAVEVPPNLMGDYHIHAQTATASPAINAGIASYAAISAPARDIDGDARPGPVGLGGGFEIGADERGPLSGFTTIIPGSAREFFLYEFYLPYIGR